MNPKLSYIGGDVFLLENFDVEFLSIITVKDVYTKKLGYNNMKHV